VGIGDFSATTAIPTASLHVKGDARVETLPSGALTDSVVTADTAGNLRKVSTVALSYQTLGMPIRRTTANVDSALDNDYTIIASTTTSNNQTINLPNAANRTGKVYVIVCQSNTNTVTVQSNTSANLIFPTNNNNLVSQSTLKLSKGNQWSIMVQSDGQDWDVLFATSQITNY
jgi:hypothetical protein